VLSCPLKGGAQEDPQTLAIEAEETRTALDLAMKELGETNKKLGALRESLAESNRVTDEVRSQYEELLLRMASFGVDLVKPDPKSLEQRLLQAVRDRDKAETEKQELAHQLAGLSEAVVGYLQTTVSSDANAQARVQNALVSADAALGQATRPATEVMARPLQEGQVVSVDAEIGLVVLNVGRESGVRIGMPISVKRQGEAVVTALVVDVRDSISGALIESSTGAGDVKVGDRIEPRAL
ncbi:MAG: hypothetical protein KDN19_22775, partial [Verrucomicrobiae bacterium]|nr:hypothetical protein [Verrucomicrobiae bacterium]